MMLSLNFFMITPPENIPKATAGMLITPEKTDGIRRTWIKAAAAQIWDKGEGSSSARKVKRYRIVYLFSLRLIFKR